MRVPLKSPRPDIGAYNRMILGEERPGRVHFCELHLDTEVLRAIVENELGRTWADPVADDRRQLAAAVKNYIECFHRLGYDCVRYTTAFRPGAGLHFPSSRRCVADTAGLSRETREWAEEGRGVISSWEDFERYPWPKLEDVDLWIYEFTAANLPEGMGFFACPGSGLLEIPMNDLFGYTNLCYLSHDEPELVAAVFERAGELIYGCYRMMTGMDGLAGFFQGDDMGFNTGTLMPPDFLRRHVLPWHKKLAALAHEQGLPYILHCCGDVDAIMEDLIEDVGIDARHSFEDSIETAGEFSRRYGNRIAVLGGVDLDKLCRLGEPELRAYVRGVLEECLPRGRYALGSGNSIANYVPVKNYLIMLDEGLHWQEEHF